MGEARLLTSVNDREALGLPARMSALWGHVNGASHLEMPCTGIELELGPLAGTAVCKVGFAVQR